MEELLSELKDACHSEPSPSDADTIRRGESTWFRGRPARAPEGTVALASSDAERVIINEGDVRAVEKQGEHYSVEVSADANVLLRIDKLLKASALDGRDSGVSPSPIMQQRDGGPFGDPTEVTVCTYRCYWISFGYGRIRWCELTDCTTTKA